MELFYNWDDDLNKAKYEYSLVQEFGQTGILKETTPYIDEILKSDLIVDFSGEMWGSHVDCVGDDRFEVGLIKNRIAQLLKKKTVMIANSIGPFREDLISFAKIVFEGFDLVLNREAVSTEIIKKYGFSTENVKSYACPSFLFEAANDEIVNDVLLEEKISVGDKKTVCIMLCGYNFTTGKYLHIHSLMGEIIILQNNYMNV